MKKVGYLSKKDITIRALEDELEKLYKATQEGLNAVWTLSAQARVSKKKEDFDEYVKASEKYEKDFNRLVKINEQLRTLKNKRKENSKV